MTLNFLQQPIFKTRQHWTQMNADKRGFWRLICKLRGFCAWGKLGAAIILGMVLIAFNSSPVFSDAGSAQQNEHQPVKFEAFTTTEGLSNDRVHAVLQDRTGFLWIGTEAGLNRYDGYNFQVFLPQNSNGLSAGWITALAEDDDGNIWIGTENGGLNRYDPETGHFTHFKHNPAVPQSLAADRVTAIFIASDNTLWIGTSQGLDRFDPWAENFEHHQHNPDNPNSLPANHINALTADQTGNLWVGTTNGLSKIDPEKGVIATYQHDPNISGTPASNAINALFIDKFKTLWIGTDAGLDRLELGTQSFTHFGFNIHNPIGISHPVINTIFEDSQGVLWVGTHYGLNQFDRQTTTFQQHLPQALEFESISHSKIAVTYEDREGLLWIGTVGGGLNKLDRGRTKFTHFWHEQFDANSLSHNNVNQITGDQFGNLWIATGGGGRNYYNPHSPAFEIYRNEQFNTHSLSSDEVHAVFIGSDQKIWVGTEVGMDRLHPQSRQFQRYRHNPYNPETLGGIPVYWITADQNGILWIGHGRGFDQFNPKTEEFTHFFPSLANPNSLSGPDVVTMQTDTTGIMWIGTLLHGLNRFDPETQTFEHYRHDPVDPTSISSDMVLSLYTEPSGVVWVGTSNGLNRFDPNLETFELAFGKEIAAGNLIYGIVPDETGNLWLSTNNGVLRYDPAEGDCTLFDERDGLQGKAFNLNAHGRTISGKIMFGGTNGFNLFDPKSIRVNPIPPQIVFTQISVGSEDHFASGNRNPIEINLRWPNNHFEFEFSALSFAEPEENQYAYKLHGFDDDWNQIGTRRFGQYTNLPGGTYQLQIIGSNNEGVWNEEGATLKVVVIPPLWETNWFRGLASTLLILAVIGGLHLRTAQIRAQKRELEEIITARTKEIEALFEQTKDLAILEERNRLARDLHDSAKQKAFAALAQLGTARAIFQRSPKKSRNHLDEAENLVQEVLQELNFLIQELYPIALKEKGLITVMQEYAFEWENQTEIPISLSIPVRVDLTLQTQQALYRIYQEALANVARHSQANRVEIAMDKHNGYLKLSIHDNGCGFDIRHKPSGVGLRSMEERAHLVSGNLALKSTPDCGTTIEVKVPL